MRLPFAGGRAVAIGVLAAAVAVLVVLATRNNEPAGDLREPEPPFRCPHWLSFVSTRSGRKQIYAIDIRRPRRVVRVTHLAGEAFDPTWSPDGRRLAFRLFKPTDSTVGLHVANHDGSEVRQLVEGGVTPSWSPDGRWIAYASAEGLSIVDPSRALSGQAGVSRRLTRTDGRNPHEYPSWSPDGRRLLFAGYSRGAGGEGSYDIWTVNADGSELLDVSRHPALDYGATWSGDGSRIVFSSLRRSTVERGEDLFVMDADGSNVELLLLRGGAPASSPDGRWIAFSSVRGDEGNSDIFLMRSDGSRLRRLTSDPSGDYSPAWIGTC